MTMAPAVKFLAVVLLCNLASSIHGLNQATEFSIRSKIRAMISADQPDGTRSRAGFRMLGGLVRLAFHDCVGKRCDGCVNIKNPENAGLDVYINIAEKLYKTLRSNGKPIMSRADFWALAAIEALEFASEFATCRRCTKVAPKIKFQTGRKDCVGKPKGSPWTDDFHEFPNPLGTTTDTTSFFKKQFGFNHMETAAIMGAHTLGVAHRQASGFSHPWVERRNHFNNEYYKALVDKSKNWTPTQVGRRSSSKWQWESRGGDRTTMMLNADMSLLKNLTGVSKYGEVRGCKYDTCQEVKSPVANTTNWVKKFAKDNKLFNEKFGKTFQKMISHGYSKLKNVDAWIGLGG